MELNFQLIAQLAIFQLVGSFLYTFVLEPLLWGPLSHVPGPYWAAMSRYFLAYFDVKYQRNEKIAEWHQGFGPGELGRIASKSKFNIDHRTVVRIQPNVVSLANALDVREIYDTKSRFDKSTYFKRFAMNGVDNLFSTIKYTDHQQLKRHIASAYSKSNVAQNSDAIVRERISAFLKEVESKPDGLVDFFVLSDCFAHDVMTLFLYGADHGTDTILDPKERPLVVNQKRSQIYTPIWVNGGRLHGSWILNLILGKEYRRLGTHSKDVEVAIERKMAEHEADPNKDDSWSLYRHLRLSGALSRETMASEMFDDLKAGQMTTASTFTYICWRLSRHPDWQKKLQEEVRALPLNDRGELSVADLEKCTVLEAVIKETMRLHPVASGRQERVIPEGGRTLSDVYLPAGTIVIGPTLQLHHNVHVFPFPQKWIPARWFGLTDDQQKIMDLHYVPFGHGARICIGQHLAMLELRLLIATLYRSYTTKPGESATDDSMTMLSTLSAVPKGLKCELYVTKA